MYAAVNRRRCHLYLWLAIFLHFICDPWSGTHAHRACVSTSQDMCKCECISFCQSVPPPRRNEIASTIHARGEIGFCVLRYKYMLHGNQHGQRESSIDSMADKFTQTSNIIRAVFQRCRHVESFNKVALTESQFKMSQRVAFFRFVEFFIIVRTKPHISSMPCMSCLHHKNPNRRQAISHESCNNCNAIDRIGLTCSLSAFNAFICCGCFHCAAHNSINILLLHMHTSFTCAVRIRSCNMRACCLQLQRVYVHCTYKIRSGLWVLILQYANIIYICFMWVWYRGGISSWDVTFGTTTACHILCALLLCQTNNWARIPRKTILCYLHVGWTVPASMPSKLWLLLS